jgi:threonine/homoserine/homoserine lactone efflux protein
VELNLFWRGLVLGLSIAAPVGPVGILCIRRSLAHGALPGLVSGLGAATADAAYGGVAAFGLTLVMRVLAAGQGWLQLLGGAYLLGLGLRTFFSRPTSAARAAEAPGLLGAYLSTFALTLTNPLTIVSFVALFAGFGLVVASAGSRGEAAALVAGVFSGSALWWLLLSLGASRLRSRLTPARLAWVNRLSGVLIAAFGLAALFRA